MLTTDEAAYLAGIVTFDITPPVGSPLGGFAARGYHTSTGIYHRLRGTAVCLGDGETDIMLISLELLGTYDDLAIFLAEAIAAKTGFGRAQIMISCSHTHCGPAIRHDDRAWHGWINEDYRTNLVEQVAEAAEQAVTHRFPATVHRTTGHCDFAVNRRRPDPERSGKAVWAPFPDGPTDHEVPVVTIADAEDGLVKAIIFSYACHPTARSGLAIGGDYVGYALDAIGEEFLSAQAVFLQGCGGDQKPRPVDTTSETFDTRSTGQVRELGELLGSAVGRAIRSGVTGVNGPIRTAFGATTLRTERVSTETIEDALSAPDRLLREWAALWKQRTTGGAAVHSEVPLELQAIAIGDLALIGMAAEMTVEYSLRLKRDYAASFAQVIPLGYTNTMVGYVPVERQFPEYGYEVLTANQYHGYAGRFEASTETQIHTAIADLVSRM